LNAPTTAPSDDDAGPGRRRGDACVARPITTMPWTRFAHDDESINGNAAEALRDLLPAIGDEDPDVAVDGAEELTPSEVQTVMKYAPSGR
jgi:hypothetical protein